MKIKSYITLFTLGISLICASIAMEDKPMPTSRAELIQLIKDTTHEECDIEARENDGSTYKTSLKDYTPKLSVAFHMRICDLANRMGILEQSFKLIVEKLDTQGNRISKLEEQNKKD